MSRLVILPFFAAGAEAASSQLYVMRGFSIAGIIDDNPYEIGTLDLSKSAGARGEVPLKKFVKPEWGAGYCPPKPVCGGDDNSIFIFAGPGCYDRGGAEGDQKFSKPKVIRYNPKTQESWAGGDFEELARDGSALGAKFASPKWSPTSKMFYAVTEYVWDDHNPTISGVTAWNPADGAGRAIHQFPSGLDLIDGVYLHEGPGSSVIEESTDKLFVLIKSWGTSDGMLRPGDKVKRQMKVFRLPSMEPEYFDATEVPEGTILTYDAANKAIIGVAGWKFGTVRCENAKCSFEVAGTLAKLVPEVGSPGNITGPDALSNDVSITFDPASRQLSVSTDGCYKLGDPTWGCQMNTDTQKFAQYTLPPTLQAGDVVLNPTYYYAQFTNRNDGMARDWSGMVLVPPGASDAIVV